MDHEETPEALLRLLGLARRAGALVLGLDTLKNRARRIRQARVYIAPGLSERSKGELQRLASAGRNWRITELREFDLLRERLGKPGVSVAALVDEQWIRGADRCRPPDHEPGRDEDRQDIRKDPERGTPRSMQRRDGSSCRKANSN